MTVFGVVTWIIKPDKLGEFTEWYEKFLEWMKKHPDLFREVKSRRLFSHLIGGNVGGYVEIWELENMADWEKWYNKVIQSEYMTKLYPEAAVLEVPGSESTSVWSFVM